MKRSQLGRYEAVGGTPGLQGRHQLGRMASDAPAAEAAAPAQDAAAVEAPDEIDALDLNKIALLNLESLLRDSDSDDDEAAAAAAADKDKDDDEAAAAPAAADSDSGSGDGDGAERSGGGDGNDGDDPVARADEEVGGGGYHGYPSCHYSASEGTARCGGAGASTERRAVTLLGEPALFGPPNVD